MSRPFIFPHSHLYFGACIVAFYLGMLTRKYFMVASKSRPSSSLRAIISRASDTCRIQVAIAVHCDRILQRAAIGTFCWDFGNKNLFVSDFCTTAKNFDYSVFLRGLTLYSSIRVVHKRGVESTVALTAR